MLPSTICFRRIPVRECHLIPCCFEVSVLCSPAEQTLLCAVERCWRHLYTLVRFYAIEFLFVARSSFGQCFMEPSVSFYGRVLAHEMVFLSLQGVNEDCRGNTFHCSITPPQGSHLNGVLGRRKVVLSPEAVFDLLKFRTEPGHVLTHTFWFLCIH
jgi:hypothetical protein